MATQLSRRTFIKLTAATAATALVPTAAFTGVVSKKRTNWLLCDGSAISRNEFPELYEVLRDAYSGYRNLRTGEFCIPDFRGRFASEFGERSGSPSDHMVSYVIRATPGTQEGRTYVRKNPAPGKPREMTTPPIPVGSIITFAHPPEALPAVAQAERPTLTDARAS